MSEAPNTNTEANTDAPKPKRTRKAEALHGQPDGGRAREGARDRPSRAAKDVRGRLRANFDAVCKLDPSIRKAKDAANDGNRWPAMNEKVYAFVLSSKANKGGKS
jgi:hypothetical protein